MSAELSEQELDSLVAELSSDPVELREYVNTHCDVTEEELDGIVADLEGNALEIMNFIQSN